MPNQWSYEAFQKDGLIIKIKRQCLILYPDDAEKTTPSQAPQTVPRSAVKPNAPPSATLPTCNAQDSATFERKEAVRRRRFVQWETLALLPAMSPLCRQRCSCGSVWGNLSSDREEARRCWKCDPLCKRWHKYAQDTEARNSKLFGYAHGLTEEYLLSQWVRQEQRCAYSDVALSLELGHAWQASLERLDASLPYVDGNAVWILFALNTSFTGVHSTAGTSLWSRAKVELVQPLSQASVDLEALRTALVDAEWPRVRTITRPSLCPQCDAVCDESELLVQLNMGNCAGCRREFLDYLIREQSQGQLTRGELCTQLLALGGRCQLSGIPLRLTRHCAWALSLQRIDRSLPMTLANVLLIAKEFQEGQPLNWRWAHEPKRFERVFGSQARLELPMLTI